MNAASVHEMDPLDSNEKLQVVIELAVLDHFLRKCSRIRQLYNYYTIRWNHF